MDRRSEIKLLHDLGRIATALETINKNLVQIGQNAKAASGQLENMKEHADGGTSND